LHRLTEPGVYEALEALAQRLVRGFSERAAAAGVEFSTAVAGGMFGFFFHPGPVRCFEDAKQADEARFRAFFASMLEAGIYLAPSPYEAGFVSLAHGEADVDATLAAAEGALGRAAGIR
jgi:glutamate-1-semialdehyde 2,1-aminomutase